MQETGLACPLCENSENKTIIQSSCRPEDFFYKCKNCELIFLEPTKRLVRDEEKNRYLLHHNTKENIGYVQQFEILINKICKEWGAGTRILDFGCGPSPVLAELLNDRGFVCDYYDPLFFPDGIDKNTKYDILVCTEAIEHFYNPNLEINLMLSLVRKPESWICLQTRFYSAQINFDNWWYVRDPTHVVFFSEATFRFISKTIKKRILHMQDPLVIFS